MKKVLIISRRDERVEFDTAESVKVQLIQTREDTVYEACFLDEIGIYSDGNKLEITNIRSNKLLEEYDLLFFLGWYKEKIFEEVILSCAIYAQSKNIAFINQEALHNRSKSKLSQYVYAAVNGIPTGSFYFCLDSNVLLEAIDKHNFTYPCIFKAPMASRGNDNYFIKDRDELKKIVAMRQDKPFVLQQYIPNNGDLRLIVMGGQIKMAIKRVAQEGTHLSNTSKGGAAIAVEVDKIAPETLRDAETIAKLLNRELTGVDMIIDSTTNKHYFLEANNMPQISTGSFVKDKAQILSDYFDSLVST